MVCPFGPCLGDFKDTVHARWFWVDLLMGLFIFLLSIGGTPESQRELLETLSADTSDPSLSNEKRKGRTPPIANQFALGYTYQDVLDTDQEGNADFQLLTLYV